MYIFTSVFSYGLEFRIRKVRRDDKIYELQIIINMDLGFLKFAESAHGYLARRTLASLIHPPTWEYSILEIYTVNLVVSGYGQYGHRLPDRDPKLQGQIYPWDSKETIPRH